LPEIDAADSSLVPTAGATVILAQRAAVLITIGASAASPCIPTRCPRLP